MLFPRVWIALATIAMFGSADAHAVDWSSPSSVAAAAVEASPQLARVSAQVTGARELVTAAGSLPNPMLMGGVVNQHIDLSTDEIMTMYMAGASQTLPRKSKRDALRTRAELDVRKLELEAQSLRAEVEREALFSYYEIAAVDSEIDATERVRKVAEIVVSASQARYETGTALQSDLIRAELEVSDLDHDLLALRGRRQAASARLLPLLGLSPDSEVPHIPMQHHMMARAIEGGIVAPDSHPAIAELEADIEQREQDLQLARLAYRPDVEIEASYGLRPLSKDMFSVVGRVEFPFRRKTLIEPRIRAAIAERDAASRQVDETRRRLRQDLGVAAAAHAEATKQIELHESRLVPLARTATESALAAYQSGKDNFESVLNAQKTSLSLEIDLNDFVLRHIQAITDFEAIRKGARGGAMSGLTTSPAGVNASVSSAGMSSMQ